MSEIPNDIISKVKKSRKEEYERGWAEGIEFAKKYDYPAIEEAVKRGEEFVMSEYGFSEKSKEFMRGFMDALTKILLKTEEKREEEISLD